MFRNAYSCCYLFVLFILLEGCACLTNPCEHVNYTAPAPLVDIDLPEVSRMVIKTSDAIGRDWDLHLFDSKVVYNEESNGIDSIYLEYTSQELLEMDDARRMLVDIVEGLVYRINNNTLLRTQISLPPFSFADVDVLIRLESFFGKYIDPFYVAMIQLDQGMAYYYSFNAFACWRDSDNWEVRTEPYEKSRLFVEIEAEEDLPYIDRVEQNARKRGPFSSFPPINDDPVYPRV